MNPFLPFFMQFLTLFYAVETPIHLYANYLNNQSAQTIQQGKNRFNSRNNEDLPGLMFYLKYKIKSPTIQILDMMMI